MAHKRISLGRILAINYCPIKTYGGSYALGFIAASFFQLMHPDKGQ